MRLIDRRLGLLFCAFFLIFSFALVRAFWLQGVKGGTLRAEARSQQVTTVTIPGERGRVLDRNGKVLAASEDAADVVATPYQVENPGRTATRLHQVLGEPTSDLLNALSDRNSGFAYLARKVDPNVAAEVKRLDITGDLDCSHEQAALSAGRARLAGDRRGRHRQPGSHRARALGEQRARRCQRRGGHRSRRGRPAASHGDRQARQRRRGRPDHARRGDPGQDRGGAERGRRPLRRQGRDRDRDEPEHGRRPRDGQHAGLRSLGPLQRDLQRAREPRHGLHLRARLDLQGLHRRLGARGPCGHPELQLLSALGDPRL